MGDTRPASEENHVHEGQQIQGFHFAINIKGTAGELKTKKDRPYASPWNKTLVYSECVYLSECELVVLYCRPC